MPNVTEDQYYKFIDGGPYTAELASNAEYVVMNRSKHVVCRVSQRWGHLSKSIAELIALNLNKGTILIPLNPPRTPVE